MGYISKAMSGRQIFFCFAIILIGGAFMMYEVCMQTYTTKEKPCVITISVEDLCKKVGKNNE